MTLLLATRHMRTNHFPCPVSPCHTLADLPYFCMFLNLQIMLESTRRTELSELGEFGLINRLTRGIRPILRSTVKGIGDDAAVVHYGDNMALVTTDLLIESVHFDLTYMPLKHLGYKAAVVNFSDIAAMNGTPRQLFVGIGVSNRFSVEAIEEIYSGILLACKNYQVDLAGGDTVSSRSGLFISMTVTGEAPAGDIVYRHTARKGDLLCVSGDLGAAYAGLLLLQREQKVFDADPTLQPDLAGHDYIVGRQLRPEARTDIVRLLKELRVKPTSMIDISDGLASEILHLCKSSRVGCTLYEDKIPMDTTTVGMAEEFSLPPATCALNGGEDYELLFTITLEDYEKMKAVREITLIGHMTGEEEGVHLVTSSGSLLPLTAQGWDAFLRDKNKPL
jgi:thiamine-monophosphate kinase